ncbi:MAG: PQQ-binding-like beta-propeller repeat protein [Armatimonadetes bacterium]|nr:PQQ-binding-like beta-propeller repeat protein [Armatimonadota bacterium]
MRLNRINFCYTGVLLLLVAIHAFGLTITGKVFVDVDGDGLAGARDIPLDKVAVSDGWEVVLTDGSGNYSLETEGGRIVFVSLPKGYRPAKSFFSKVGEVKRIDFPMVPWPESLSKTLRFVQITDIHVNNEETVKTFSEDIDEINALTPKPAFVILTGDLVNVGSNIEEYENYVRAISRFKIPFFNVFGNHDACRGEDRLANYHKFLGPDYYSFNVGDYHILVINCLDFDANNVQKEWIAKDLAASPKGTRLIFAQHFWPGREQLKYFASLGGLLIVSGHWHGNRVSNGNGILDLNTPPLRFGGIDRNARGFRIVEISGEEASSELRLAGFHENVTVVSPAGYSFAPKGNLKLLVNAYDTRSKITKVECEVGKRKTSLKPAGSWSWIGEIKVDSQSSDAQKLIATVTDISGRTWKTESAFQAIDNMPSIITGTDWPQFHGDHHHLGSSSGRVCPPLRLAWAAHAGGFIGISSPVVGEGLVFVGTNDLGNLKDCGVYAFDAKSGKLRWRFKTDSAVKNSVAFSKGRVFAISVTGYLYSLDAQNGRLLWKQGLRAENERWEIAAPVVFANVVYAGGTTYLAAFKADSGERLWEVDLGGLDWWPSCPLTPMISGSQLIITSRTGAFGIDRKTGKKIWELDGNFRGCSAVGEFIYAIRNGFPVAINPIDGKIVWESTEKLGDSASTPAISGETMVVGDADGRICAFSTKDGKLLWTFQTGPSVSSLQPYKRGGSDVNSSPAISGNTVYIGASDGKLYALSLTSGEELWSHNLGVPIASSPAISGNAVYIGAYDGNVYAFIGQ